MSSGVLNFVEINTELTPLYINDVSYAYRIGSICFVYLQSIFILLPLLN